jgi:hypothetical protein
MSRASSRDKSLPWASLYSRRSSSIRSSDTRVSLSYLLLVGPPDPQLCEDDQPSAAALVVNEEQAAVVRSVFEMYASGQFSTAAISRALEERGVPTYKRGRLWDHGRIVRMLKNHTYMGTCYFNTMSVVRDHSYKYSWWRVLNFVTYNGILEAHNSLLNVALHNNPHVGRRSGKAD